MGALKNLPSSEEREEADKKMRVAHYIVDQTYGNADEDDKRRLRRKLRTKKNDDLNHLVTLIEMHLHGDARTYILNLID